MPRKLVNMRLPMDLLARADAEAEKLGQTRTKFVERALESALKGGGVSSIEPTKGTSQGSSPSAPTRASEVPPPDPDRRRPLAPKLPPGVEKGTKNVKPRTPPVADTWRR